MSDDAFTRIGAVDKFKAPPVNCPNCKMKAATRVRTAAEGRLPGSSLPVARSVIFGIVECVGCRTVFVIKQDKRPKGGTHFETLFPPDPPPLRAEFEGVVPEIIMNQVREAVATYRAAAYRASGVMSRAALEGFCLHFGQTSGKLVAKITKLAEAGQITPQIADWAHALRLTGNDAAHGMDNDFGEPDARDALELLDMMLLCAFVLNERVRKRLSPDR